MSANNKIGMSEPSVPSDYVAIPSESGKLINTVLHEYSCNVPPSMNYFAAIPSESGKLINTALHEYLCNVPPSMNYYVAIPSESGMLINTLSFMNIHVMFHPV